MSCNAEFTHHPSAPRRPDEKKPPKMRRYARKWQEARTNAASKNAVKIVFEEAVEE